MAAPNETGDERTARVRILYDGECPFCAQYVKMARLRDRVGDVELLDAREHAELVAQHTAAGRPIDDGMIVETPDEIYYGGDAIYAINALLSDNPVLNLLSGRAMLKFVYPVLRFGRNSALRLKGRKPINPSHKRVAR